MNAVPPTSKPFGRLLAWDPVAQKEVWRVEHVSPWNGGTLTTAGNLVFQGTADGRFVAYNAKTGKKVWQAPTGTGVVPTSPARATGNHPVVIGGVSAGMAHCSAGG